MKKYLSLGLIAIMAFFGCATTRGPQPAAQTSAVTIPIDDLLSKLPAHDALDQSLLMNAMIEHGTSGVIAICERLNGTDTTARVQAQYALTGLAHFVTGDDRDAQRQAFVKAIEQALTGPYSVPDKSFFITLLQYCGRDDQVATLSQYLTDEKLCDPAARALVTIGTPAAAQALLSALPNARGETKVSIIKALGELRYAPAAVKLREGADSKDADVRRASLYALANIGYLPAASVLKAAVEQDGTLMEHYITFFKRLAEQGHADKSIALCRQILANDGGHYTAQSRIEALTTLVDLNSTEAADDILKAVTDGGKKMRVAALRLAQELHDPGLTERLIMLVSTSQPDVQVDVIATLGRMACRKAVPLIREALTSGNPSVRVSSVVAISQILGDEAAEDLISALQSADENEREIIREQLATLHAEDLIQVAKERFDALSAEGRVLLIDLLGSQRATGIIPLCRQSLSSDVETERLAAIRALAFVGGKMEVTSLLEDWKKHREMSERRAVQRALRDIGGRINDSEWMLAQLTGTFESLPPKDKIAMLAIFKNIGNRQCLQFVQSQLKKNELKEAAMRTLLDWPNEMALDTIMDVATATRDEDTQILAIRGALRLIRQTPMGQRRAFFYYQQLWQAANRPQEKRQVLAGLATLKLPSALKIVAQQLSDDAIAYDAATAAVKIASRGESESETLGPEQVAQTFIEAQADEALQQRIAENPLVETKMNRPPKGFSALFNGKDLTGWKGLVGNPVTRARMSAEELAAKQKEADESMRQHWHVIDGVLFFDGKGENLCTVEDYGNFEMYVDWKIEKHGDSGIYLRGTPQVQIWDRVKGPKGSGGLYNNKKHGSDPLVCADKPVGQWNTFHIIMKGDRVTVYLNDVLVVNNEVMENYWERDKPIYATGPIELQAHHTPLYFRNIFIRELPPEEPPFSGALFNGKDLTGWQVVGNKADSWKVKDGILYTNVGGGGWLSTTRQFSDFKLELEFRVPPGGNSGVFLRSPRQGNPAYVGMEIQVLDDYAKKYANLKPWQYTGSIYGIQAPSKRVSKKANEWQKMIIVCKGPQVQVTLNGEKIIDANLINYMDQEKMHPGIKRRKGYIGLQNHSSRIEYRNIQLVELK